MPANEPVHQILAQRSLADTIAQIRGRQLAAAGAQLGDPADHGDGQHRLGARAFAHGEERVTALAGDGAGIADTFEIPVLTAVVSVSLPVVAGGVVATVSIEHAVKVRECGSASVGDAVYVRIDWAKVGVSVH